MLAFLIGGLASCEVEKLNTVIGSESEKDHVAFSCDTLERRQD